MSDTAFDRLSDGTYTCTGRLGRAHGFQDKVDWNDWQSIDFRVRVLKPVRGRRSFEARAITIMSQDFAEFDTSYADTGFPNQLMAEDYLFEVQPDVIMPRAAPAP